MRKEKLKKSIVLLCLMAALIVLYIAWPPFSLMKCGERTASYSLDKELKMQVASETKDMASDKIRKYSIKKTSDLLTFTAKNDIANGKANCVGYAQLCAGIYNYACQVNGLDCTAKPVVGYLMFYQFNLCNLLTWCMPNKHWKNFVKDHDFVEFHINNFVIYSDASLYDIIGDDCSTAIGI